MFGREELRTLRQQKEALVARSESNRVVLQQSLQALRASIPFAGGAPTAAARFSPLLMVLAPLTRFFLDRAGHRSGSWLGRVTRTVGLVLPLYRLWRGFRGRRRPTAG